MKPTKPGFYWALWLTAAEGTHEGDQLTPANDWEVAEVWENFKGEPCEVDQAEKLGVSVPGVREAQWLDNFKWGEEVKRPNPISKCGLTTPPPSEWDANWPPFQF